MAAFPLSKRAATRRFKRFNQRPNVLAATRRLKAVPGPEISEMTAQMVKLARAAFSLQLTPALHKRAIEKLAATSSIPLADLHVLAMRELEQMLFDTVTGTAP